MLWCRKNWKNLIHKTRHLEIQLKKMMIRKLRLKLNQKTLKIPRKRLIKKKNNRKIRINKQGMVDKVDKEEKVKISNLNMLLKDKLTQKKLNRIKLKKRKNHWRSLKPQIIKKLRKTHHKKIKYSSNNHKESRDTSKRAAFFLKRIRLKKFVQRQLILEQEDRLNKR